MNRLAFGKILLYQITLYAKGRSRGLHSRRGGGRPRGPGGYNRSYRSWWINNIKKALLLIIKCPKIFYYLTAQKGCLTYNVKTKNPFIYHIYVGMYLYNFRFERLHQRSIKICLPYRKRKNTPCQLSIYKFVWKAERCNFLCLVKS